MILIIAIIAALLNAGLVPLNSFEAAYIRGILHGSAVLLSSLSISISCGTIVGAFIYPYLHTKISNKWLLLSLGLVLGAYNIILAGLPMLSNEIYIKFTLLVSSFLLGISVGCGGVLASSSFMTHVEKEYLARASAIFSALACSLMPIFSITVGIISRKIGVLPIFLSFGLIFIVMFVLLFRLKEMNEI